LGRATVQGGPQSKTVGCLTRGGLRVRIKIRAGYITKDTTASFSNREVTVRDRKEESYNYLPWREPGGGVSRSGWRCDAAEVRAYSPSGNASEGGEGCGRSSTRRTSEEKKKSERGGRGDQKKRDRPLKKRRSRKKERFSPEKKVKKGRPTEQVK